MSNQLDLQSFQDEINAILDHDLKALAKFSDGVEAPSVKAFLEEHYAAHNEVRSGLFFNEALKTNAFTDDKAYLMLHKITNDAEARVYIGSDAEIIGRFKQAGEPMKEFTMGHEPDSQLYKVAVGISKQLGTDLAANDYVHTIEDDRIAYKKEIPESSFSEWLQNRLEDHADKFPSIAVKDVIEVLDVTDFWFEEGMQDLIKQERFNKDIANTPDALIGDIDRVGQAINEVVHVDGFEKVAVAFKLYVPDLVNYNANEFKCIYEDELKAAYPEQKKKPSLKP
ncbi:hypothetical protein SOX05_08490 [Pseudomonas putida]|nr:hypothetical protein [Pseudomonas putida]MDY4319298.1 hypothetical protein [Pseudomonas putida]MDY4352683.1 hypothetical protein [Pseudomonas putida]